MPTTIGRDRVRLQIDVRRRTAVLDVLTSTTPEMWRGTDIQFEFALFDGDALADPSLIDSVTLAVKAQDDRDGSAVISGTVGALNSGLTLDQWNDGTDQHGMLVFTAAETNVNLGAEDNITFWLVLSALTTHTPARSLVLGTSFLKIMEDGSGGDTVAPIPTIDYFTKDESDARYQMVSAIDGIEAEISDLNTAVDALDTRLTTDEATIASQGTAITALGTSDAAKIPLSQKGSASGVAPLDSSSKVALTYLPAVATPSVGPGLMSAAQATAVADVANKIPSSEKGAASGVAPLDGSSKVALTYLPAVATPSVGPGLMSAAQATAVADIANKIPFSEKGSANGVATLDSSGLVPTSQLPGGGGGLSLSGTEGIIEVISLDEADLDVGTTPAYKNYLMIKRNTSFVTSPPVNDALYFWNDGDGGGVATWWPISAPTYNPKPLIIPAYSTSGTFSVGFWLATGSSAGAAARYTIDDTDPDGSSTVAPAYPNAVAYTATAGEAWTDGGGTHYRWRFRCRTYCPDLTVTPVTVLVLSVNSDGSLYSLS